MACATCQDRRRGEQSISLIPSLADSRCEAFLEEHSSVIRAASMRACPRDLGVPVEEIEQEVRLRLWKFLQGETEITSPASFIGRIAATASIDAVRRVKARREEPLIWRRASDDSGDIGPPAVGADSSPEQAAQYRELGEKILVALERIVESRQSPVRLHLQGFSEAEIARLFGYTEAKVRNLVSRGVRDLARELGRLGVGP